MLHPAKNAEYSSSDEEEEEESESEEEEQPKVVKGRVDSKVPERNQQEEEESSEEEEDSEADNDAQRYNTVRREGNSAGAAKAVISNNPAGKRGRDVEGKDEEPASKKSREAKVEKGRAAVKPASPPRPTRGEPTGKGSKVVAAKGKPEKATKVEEITKASAAGRKRKAPSPPANGTGKQQSQKVEVTDKGSPQKPKTPFTWTSNLEIALSSALYHEKAKGKPIPPSKTDPYWAKLIKDLGSDVGILTETQLCEKVRRMKNRYNQLKAKDVESPWRNPHEEKLYRFWDSIWGSGKYAVLPKSSQGVAVEEESEDEESSDDEEEIATPAVVKGSKGLALTSRKEESSESEEDDAEEEPEAAPQEGGTSREGPLKEAELSAFVPKPRLEFTPILPKDEKKKTRKDDGSIAEQSGAELSGDENDREVQAMAALDNVVRDLKKESFAVLQEVRASVLDAVSNIRKQSMSVLDDLKDINTRLGVNAPTSGMWRTNGSSVPSLDRGMLEELMTSATRSGLIGAGSSVVGELKSQWRQLRAEEMDLLEKRMQLTVKQLQLAKKEFLEEQDS